jgi:hypothetical protein
MWNVKQNLALKRKVEFVQITPQNSKPRNFSHQDCNLFLKSLNTVLLRSDDKVPCRLRKRQEKSTITVMAASPRPMPQ